MATLSTGQTRDQLLRSVAQLYGQVRTDWNQCFVIDCSEKGEWCSSAVAATCDPLSITSLVARKLLGASFILVRMCAGKPLLHSVVPVPYFWSPILPVYKNFLDPKPFWISVFLKPEPDYPKLFENLPYV